MEDTRKDEQTRNPAQLERKEIWLKSLTLRALAEPHYSLAPLCCCSAYGVRRTCSFISPCLFLCHPTVPNCLHKAVRWAKLPLPKGLPARCYNSPLYCTMNTLFGLFPPQELLLEGEKRAKLANIYPRVWWRGLPTVKH